MPTTQLGDCFDLVMDARLDEALSILGRQMSAPQPGPGQLARLASVAAFAEALRARYPAALAQSKRASAAALESGDRSSQVFAVAAATVVACLAPPTMGLAVPDTGMWRPGELDLEDEVVCIAGYLAIEASMSAGRLLDAQLLATAYLAIDLHSSVRAAVFAEVALARSLVFQGHLADAASSAARAIATADDHGGVSARMLAASTAAYIAAQGGATAETDRLTREVLALEPNPTSYITVGAHILCAYGLGAVGQVTRAAELIVHAGGGPALPRLQTVDRAYAYELLATAAIERADLTAARAFGRRAAPLRLHDMAAAAVERTLSRIDIAMGRSESAAERAAVSSARALVAGGNLDATRSRVLEASALAATGARGAAVAGFRDAAERAESLGAVAVRNWSARELRRLGRRLRPAAGSGWQALSRREQQITLLAAEGYSNRMIGQALFLSERTVQSHLSRALAALGAASRAALPVSLGREPSPERGLDGLTSRQQQVAYLVAEGCSNRTISERLGISDKTVEKHIQAIFSRWNVSSRTGIANRVLSVPVLSAAVPPAGKRA